MPQTGSIASEQDGFAVRAGVAPGDELGQDRDGDLRLRRRAEVEPGRAVHARERVLADPALSQARRARPRRAARSPRARRTRPGPPEPTSSASSSAWPIVATTTASASAGQLGRHPPVDRARELRERDRGLARRRRSTSSGRRQLRLDQHFDHPLRGARALRDHDVSRPPQRRESGGPIRTSRGSPSASARSASRITIGSEQAPPTQPSSSPSGVTSARSPGRVDAGRSTRTTVART